MMGSRLPLALAGTIAFLPAIGDAESAGDAVAPNAPAASTQRTNAMQIRLTVDGKPLAATLLDNATARDLLSMLPVVLTLEDYAATEKIAYLSRKLSIAGAPAGADPSVGDIAYYAPWGNLALFYKGGPDAGGLIYLGKFDGDYSALNHAKTMTIDVAK